MPRYRKECGDCGEEFLHWATIAERNNVSEGCPACGGENIEHLMPTHINVISDLDQQDGRTGDSIPMPSFGTRIRSRRQLKDLQKRAPEEHYNRTGGNGTITRGTKPVHSDRFDPESPMVMEEYEVHNKGIELGEVHTMEECPEERPVMSAFDKTGKMTVDEHQALLVKRVGEEIL